MKCVRENITRSLEHFFSFFTFFLFTFLMGRYCLTDVWKKWYIICERNANSGRSASANRGVYSVPLERSHAKKSTYLVRQNVFAFAWSVYSILLYFFLYLLKNIPIPHPLYLIKNYYKKDDTWIIKNDFHGYTIMRGGKNICLRDPLTRKDVLARNLPRGCIPPRRPSG